MFTWIILRLKHMFELFIEMNEDRVSIAWLKKNTDYWSNRRDF